MLRCDLIYVFILLHNEINFEKKNKNIHKTCTLSLRAGHFQGSMKQAMKYKTRRRWIVFAWCMDVSKASKQKGH
jgi:hypothetical protein